MLQTGSKRIKCILALFCMLMLFNACTNTQAQEYSQTPATCMSTRPLPAGELLHLPVLMYHHLAEEAHNPWTVTPQAFAVQMRALQEAGFTAITMQQLLEFVDYGAPLPPYPVLITFDDGYLSVYQYAFPILEQYGHVAVSFIIGHAVGTSTYKDTGHPTTPKFDFQQARNMAGIVDIQSHSYDMHQWAPFEEGRARENILMWYDECPHEYEQILRGDHLSISNLVYNNLGHIPIAIAYPHGIYDQRAQDILTSMGVRISFSTREGVALIEQGNPQTLLAIPRFNIDNYVTASSLMQLLGTIK